MSENPFMPSQTLTQSQAATSDSLNSDIVLELDLELELDSDDTLYSKSQLSQITNETPTPTRRNSTSASQLCLIQSTPKCKPSTNRNNILKLIHILYARKFASKQKNDNLKQSSRPGNDKNNKNEDNSFFQAYNKYEEKVLLKLETFVSYIDNFIAFQAIFPAVHRQTKTLKILKPISSIVRQFSKIYIIVILINMKRFLQRFFRLQKLIKTLEAEYLLINENYMMNNETNELSSTQKETLLVLYTEKFKSIVEIFGYFNDLLLNLNLVSKRFRLNKLLDRFVGFMSWIISIYRFSKDEDEELKSEKLKDDLEKRYNFG